MIMYYEKRGPRIGQAKAKLKPTTLQILVRLHLAWNWIELGGCNTYVCQVQADQCEKNVAFLAEIYY